MSAEVKQEGLDTSVLGPAAIHNVPYIGGGLDDIAVDEKSDKDRSPSDSETAIDQLDKEGHVGDDFVIRSGADASKHLLSLRDDEDPVLTFRSALLGTAFACFQAAMNQIYNVSAILIRYLPELMSSSNRLMRQYRVLSWCCSSTSLAKPGRSCYPEATKSPPDGDSTTLTKPDYRFMLLS